MSDPLSALSIAASILQIIDAGLKVVSATHEIYKRGSTIGNKELKTVAKDIRHVNENLTETLKPLSPNSPGLTDGEIRLQNLASEASEVAKELIEALDKLECQPKDKCWTSFRKALKTVWSKSKVDETAERLDNFRSELVLRIVVSLKLDEKFKYVRQDKRFDTLEDMAKRIAETLLDNRNFFTMGIEDTQTTILTQQDLESSKAQKRHEETIAAIATLRGFGDQSETRTTWSSSTFSDDMRKSSLRDLREIQVEVLDFLAFRRMTSRKDEVVSSFQRTFQWIYAGTQSRNKPQIDLAHWLQYENGCYWVSGKAGSGKSTLMKFISEEPHTEIVLSKWAAEEPLLCASFYFWHAGTSLQRSQLGLLRSILHDALRKYPQLIPVVFPGLCRAISRGRVDASEPSFTELKSAFTILTTQDVLPLRFCFFIDGIDEYDGDHAELAKLLLSVPSSRVKLVLSSRPTPACIEAFSSCPRLQLHDLTGEDIYLYVQENLLAHPRMEELQAKNSRDADRLATEVVSKASGVFLWVVLVVKSLLTGFRNYDGIEVLHQRLEELPTDLESLYKHMLKQMEPFYRIQASKFLQIMYRNSKMPRSRPLTLLRLSLANETSPGTAIEADIEQMSSEEKIMRCKEMEGRIRSHCCGLLEVQRRQCFFPTSDLKSIDDAQESIDIIDIDMDRLTVFNGFSITVSHNPEKAIISGNSTGATGVEDSKMEGLPANGEAADREGECLTLHDVKPHQRKSQDQSDDELINSEVHFLHKSVIDFMEMPEVWESLVTLTSPTRFDANVSLASSSLLEIKTAAKEYDTQIDISSIWSSLYRGLIECAAAEASTSQAQDLLLDEYDAAMDFHWREIRGWMPRYGMPFNKAGHWSNRVPSANSLDNWPCGGPHCNSIFSLACRFGLKLYVKRVLDRRNDIPSLLPPDRGCLVNYNNPAQTALNYLVCNILGRSDSELFWDNEIAVLKLSLQHGADPNLAFYEDRSPWQIALWRCNLLSLVSTQQWTELLQILLRGGADPNAPYLVDIFAHYDPNFQVPGGQIDVRWWQSPLTILKDRYSIMVEKTCSKTETREINHLWEKLQALIIQKGGVYNQWVEEEKEDWDKTRPEDKWEIVTDPVRKANIISDIQ